MIRNDCSEIVMKAFDFGWKIGDSTYPADLLALEYQKGDILDVGCGDVPNISLPQFHRIFFMSRRRPANDARRPTEIGAAEYCTAGPSRERELTVQLLINQTAPLLSNPHVQDIVVV